VAYLIGGANSYFSLYICHRLVNLTCQWVLSTLKWDNLLVFISILFHFGLCWLYWRYLCCSIFTTVL
jgi:hypothetical protein